MVNKLKELRYRRMMNASELSRRSGVSRQTIWKIEHEPNKKVRSDTMFALAKALDYQVSEIFFTQDV